LKQLITSTSQSGIYIPTPDASKEWNDYAQFYEMNFKQPVEYIKCSEPVEEFIGLLYCSNEKDQEWLDHYNRDSQQLSLVQLEGVLYRLENLQSKMIACSDLEQHLVAQGLDDLVKHAPAIFEHWQQMKAIHMKPLMPMITVVYF
jgi:hypothetical protein